MNSYMVLNNIYKHLLIYRLFCKSILTKKMGPPVVPTSAKLTLERYIYNILYIFIYIYIAIVKKITDGFVISQKSMYSGLKKTYCFVPPGSS